MANTIPNLTEPLYIILFESQIDIKYSTTVSVNDLLSQYRQGKLTLPLGFDKNLSTVLPAFWYCLHLPRTRFDFQNISNKSLKTFQDQIHQSHHIFSVPIPWPQSAVKMFQNDFPKIVFAPNELREEAATFAKGITNVVDIALISSLNQERLPQHWKALYKALKVDKPQYIKASRLINDSGIRAAMVPAIFLVRQLLEGSETNIPSDFESQDEVLRYLFHYQALLSALALLEDKDLSTEKAKEAIESVLEKEKMRFRCPVAIATPGISPRSLPREVEKALKRKGLFNSADKDIEDSVLSFLVAHQAVSRNGIGFLSRRIPDDAFIELDRLETAWALARPKPHLIWKLLYRIGKIISNCFSNTEIRALLHASSLINFSEFPIGLAILPGKSAPLCCRVPIAYRPLAPLTRALQMECLDSPLVHLRGNLKVLAAECIDSNDLVGKLSRSGWLSMLRLNRDIPNLDFQILEVERVEQIVEALRKSSYDILVISAHGKTNGNRTGIVCGNKLVVGDEFESLPSVVCLSACQVSPRGRGTVNITDLMFRRGAKAIIGTMVPINVMHNATLMARFFANVAEALQGRGPGKTLETVWNFTATSNAVNDILRGNKGLSMWARSIKDGKSVIGEFMLERSRHKLRGDHIYEDSEAILAEIARDRGIEAKFRAWMINPGYLPESLFYVVMGWPDRIVFYDQKLEEMEQSFPKP